MPWIEATLRDQCILVRCDAGGKLAATEGRVDVVYKAGASKLYRAGTANIVVGPQAAQYTDEQVAKGGLSYLSDAPPPKATKASPTKTTAGSYVDPGTASDGTWVAYTDGACSGNPGPAGAGFVLLGPNKETIEGYDYLGSQTNNVGELVGIERALDLFPNDADEVTIYTDSKYAIGVLSKEWKAKANVDLIARIKKKLKARVKVNLVYVKGHAGIEYNEKADELARLAVSSKKSHVSSPKVPAASS